jgi:RHS repeat-associated protein
MIAIQHLPLRRISIIALVAFVSSFISYPSAHAQATGPTVDECSSGEVDSSYGVEETVCLSGSQSGLNAYAEVDNGGGGSGAANWVGVAATLLKSSTTVWSSGDVSGGTEESVSGGVTPVLNVWYTLNSTFDEGVCNYGGCNSWYGMGGLSVAVEVTGGPPAAPTNLAAQAGNASAGLTWTGSSGATSYNVYQGTSSGGESSTPVATGITGTSYIAAGLTNGTAYYFKVTAVGTGGTSGYSNETSTTPQPPATTVYSFSVNYDAASNVSGYNDSVMGTWSVVTSGGSSGYDSLNRLIAAKATAGPYYSQSAPIQAVWSYDSFGNRKSEQFNGSPSGTVPVPVTSYPAPNTNNQTPSVQVGTSIYTPKYDAAGNVICDNYVSGQCMVSPSTNAYSFDADGRLCAVDASSGAYGYLYDADGTRVAKGTIQVVLVTVNGQQVLSCDTNPSDTTTYNHFIPTTAYVLDSGNQQMTEVTTSNGGGQWTWKHTNVSASGQLVATYSTSSGQPALNFHFTDWLGTRRVLTDSLGNTQQSCHSLPYGNGEDCTPTPTEQLFTGKERDQESSNDYFGARYYESSMGRFMSPDWNDDPEPTPYAELDDPQSLNLYGYARNNPLTNNDPDGHGCQTTTFRTEFAGQITMQATVTDNSTCSWFVWQPLLHPSYHLGGQYTRWDTKAIHAIFDPIMGDRTCPPKGCNPIEDDDAIPFVPGGFSLELKPLASSPELQAIINELYRSSDTVLGGTAGAIRQEIKNGIAVGGKMHFTKGVQRALQLEKSIAGAKFSGSDLDLARAILQDLRNAMSGK